MRGLPHSVYVVQEGNDPTELAKSLSETAVKEVSQTFLSMSALPSFTACNLMHSRRKHYLPDRCSLIYSPVSWQVPVKAKKPKKVTAVAAEAVPVASAGKPKNKVKKKKDMSTPAVNTASAPQESAAVSAAPEKSKKKKQKIAAEAAAEAVEQATAAETDIKSDKKNKKKPVAAALEPNLQPKAAGVAVSIEPKSDSKKKGSKKRKRDGEVTDTPTVANGNAAASTEPEKPVKPKKKVTT